MSRPVDDTEGRRAELPTVGKRERNRALTVNHADTIPNGKIVSLPTGVLKIGLLAHQIKVAGKTDRDFDEAL